MSEKNGLKTKEKLIETGIKLSSKYGFEATTTRMIADKSGENIATMPFHFKNKVNFYKQVLEYVAADVSAIYEPIHEKIQNIERSGNWNKDKAWTCICELIEVQLMWAIDLPNPEYLALVHWEQSINLDNYTPISDVVFQKAEETLAFLLTKYHPKLKSDEALILSRIINGGIITFGEYPLFLKAIKTKKTENISIKERIRNFVQKSIKSY